MRRISALMAVLVVLLGTISAVFAWAGTHGKHDPMRPLSHPNWPKGLAEIVNRTDREGGHWLNASDWFHYKGNARTFNDFLKEYGEVQTKTLILNLHERHSISVPLTPGAAAMKAGYDWELSVFGWTEKNISLKFPLDGKIALKDIRVPVTVRVQFYGNKSAACRLSSCGAYSAALPMDSTFAASLRDAVLLSR